MFSDADVLTVFLHLLVGKETATNENWPCVAYADPGSPFQARAVFCLCRPPSPKTPRHQLSLSRISIVAGFMITRPELLCQQMPHLREANQSRFGTPGILSISETFKRHKIQTATGREKCTQLIKKPLLGVIADNHDAAGGI